MVIRRWPMIKRVPGGSKSFRPRIGAQHRGHTGNGSGNKTWRHCRDGVKRDVMTWPTVAQKMGFALKIAKTPKAQIRDRVPTQRGCWTCSLIWTANPKSSPADNANAWPWVGRSCVNRRCS